MMTRDENEAAIQKCIDEGMPPNHVGLMRVIGYEAYWDVWRLISEAEEGDPNPLPPSENPPR